MGLKSIVIICKNLILSPANEWERIAVRSSGKKELLTGFVLPVIIICFLARIAGQAIFARHFEFLPALITAIIPVIVMLAAIYLTSVLVYRLAPSFKSEKNKDLTFSLISYSLIPVFLASLIEGLFPALHPVELIYLYTIYLVYTGITPLLKAPEDQKFGYVFIALVILAGISRITYQVMVFILPYLGLHTS
ncbi:MAG: Yip1 family protein [Bacteroidia bacterium]|nr:Yip1 family protein [Bacteroidia bacterium]